MKDRPVTALVELIVPKEAAGTGSISLPRQNGGALPLVQYRTEFLALKLPGMYNLSFKAFPEFMLRMLQMFREISSVAPST